jgi:hypothetical protein
MIKKSQYSTHEWFRTAKSSRAGVRAFSGLFVAPRVRSGPRPTRNTIGRTWDLAAADPWSDCTCRFLRHFVPQKPRLTGCFGSLQSKKSPCRRFLEVLRAKRNKLVKTAAGSMVTGPVCGCGALRVPYNSLRGKDQRPLNEPIGSERAACVCLLKRGGLAPSEV